MVPELRYETSSDNINFLLYFFFRNDLEDDACSDTDVYKDLEVEDESIEIECCEYSSDECEDDLDINASVETTITATDETLCAELEISEIEMPNNLPPAMQKIHQSTQTYFGKESAADWKIYQTPVIIPNHKFSRSEESSNYSAELGVIGTMKVICSLDLLLQLFEGPCQIPGCIYPVSVKTVTVGVTAVITWSCLSGHKGRFCTSHKVKGLYANNIQTAASILLSGNNLMKVNRMFQFCSMPTIAKDMFLRYQNSLFFPVVQEWWDWNKRNIIEGLHNKEVVLAGDGQCDSPGKTAKYLCYYLLDITSSYVVHCEVMDKRMVGGKSATMEVEALKRSLQSLVQLLNIMEMITDASSSVIKLMSK